MREPLCIIAERLKHARLVRVFFFFFSFETVKVHLASPTPVFLFSKSSFLTTGLCLRVTFFPLFDYFDYRSYFKVQIANEFQQTIFRNPICFLYELFIIYAIFMTVSFKLFRKSFNIKNR